jgi:hypothetical protein
MHEISLPDPERCDQDIFSYGELVCVLDSNKSNAEAWVRSVAAESGQRVDWHYYGGRVIVLVLGDYSRARCAAEKLAPTLIGSILRMEP